MHFVPFYEQKWKNIQYQWHLKYINRPVKECLYTEKSIKVVTEYLNLDNYINSNLSKKQILH